MRSRPWGIMRLVTYISLFESPRVCRRLTFLRELAYEQETYLLPRNACCGVLLGFDEVHGYIQERVSWLDFALENNEACGSLEYHKARLFRARALFS